MPEFRREIPMNSHQTAAIIENGFKSDTTNDSMVTHEAPWDSKVSITASAQLLSSPGILGGFKIVSFTDGATVRFSDALTATTPYLSSAQTISAALGYSADKVILLGGNKGIYMATGCYVTITGTIELIPLVKRD